MRTQWEGKCETMKIHTHETRDYICFRLALSLQLLQVTSAWCSAYCIIYVREEKDQALLIWEVQYSKHCNGLCTVPRKKKQEAN